MNVPAATPNAGGETDKDKETDAAAPQTPVNTQPSGDATDTEDVTENLDDENADTPSFISVAVKADGYVLTGLTFH